MSAQIQLEGVRVNNLQSVTLQIPHAAFTVICGISGSGKSSLAFDTLYTEGQRRYVETFSTSARQFLDRLERPAADSISGIPPAVAIHQLASAGGPRSTVGTRTEIVDALRVLFAACGRQYCPACSREVADAGPEAGARAVLRTFPSRRILITIPAANCHGGLQSPAVWLSSGMTRAVDAGRICRLEELSEFQNPEHSLLILDRLRCDAASMDRIQETLSTAFAFADHCRVLAEPAAGVSDESAADAGRLQSVAIEGALWSVLPLSGIRCCAACGRRFHELRAELLSFTSPLGACPVCQGTAMARAAATKTRRRLVQKEEQESALECSDCDGSRINEAARHVRWHDRTLPEVCQLELAEFAEWLPQALQGVEPGLMAAIGPAVGIIRRRLDLMLDIGLGYLAIDRSMASLSGGEARRTLLAAVLGSGLTGTLYVLDEPTQGLHTSDTRRVLDVIRRLQQAGNTIVVVEHETSVIRAADFVVELGPGAGAEGGRLVFAGTPSELEQADTQTGRALRQLDNSVPRPVEQLCVPQQWLRLRGVDCRTIRGLDVDLPLGVLCAVTGVSGSGKSSLIVDTLVPALRQRLSPESVAGTDRLNLAAMAGSVQTLEGFELLEKVLLLDQQPVRRSLRSIPATWLGVWDDIRGLLAETHEARRRNYSRKMFSFNAAGGGRCPVCEGRGQVTIPMQFLADIETPCSECGGRRFLPETLEIRYRDRNIHEILQMTADEAFRFFQGQYRIQHRLNAMKQAGLAYLPLGQPLSTLSGGEAQRLRIAAVLAGVPLDGDGSAGNRTEPVLTRSGRTLFVLDEPSVGLHPTDVERLMECLGFLLQTGHSVIVVDHDPLVLARADWEIRMGPGPGRFGGRVILSGPPER